MSTYSNQTNVPLILGVWLANDEYDHVTDLKHISATSLLRPTKQIILSRRVPPSEAVNDISGLVASRMGTAIHSGVERAWEGDFQSRMKAIGYPRRVIENTLVNPPDDVCTDGKLVIRVENRVSKEINGWTVSGQYDYIVDGQVQDVKSTSTYGYLKGDTEKYAKQGSIYKWLKPEHITANTMKVLYVFTDWSAINLHNPAYPRSKAMGADYELAAVSETERFIVGKLHELDTLMDADESMLPACSDEDLWRDPPIFKYYKNKETAAKSGRSTKNFGSAAEAYQRKSKDNNVGVVVEVGSSVKACKYCPAFEVCRQKDGYLLDGSLKL